jgi:phosphoribosylanthranilate isomerase
MRDTRIKICGITTPEDAELAVALGVDYVGLIFAESSRRVTIDRACEIRTAVANVMLVGVFMNSAFEEVVAISRASRINMVQLHGRESPEYCEALVSKLSLPIVKSFSRGLTVDRLAGYKRTSYFHLDLDKNARGNGNSVSHEQESLWDEAASLRSKGYRLFLAGALHSGNVRPAVKRVQPYCIDVASGVESEPGIKDHEKMRRFVMEVRR